MTSKRVRSFAKSKVVNSTTEGSKSKLVIDSDSLEKINDYLMKASSCFEKLTDLEEWQEQAIKNNIKMAGNFYYKLANELLEVDKEKAAEFLMKASGCFEKSNDLEEWQEQAIKKNIKLAGNLYYKLANELLEVDKERSAKFLMKASDYFEKSNDLVEWQEQAIKNNMKMAGNLYHKLANELLEIDKEKSAEFFMKASDCFGKSYDLADWQENAIKNNIKWAGNLYQKMAHEIIADLSFINKQ